MISLPRPRAVIAATIAAVALAFAAGCSATPTAGTKAGGPGTTHNPAASSSSSLPRRHHEHHGHHGHAHHGHGHHGRPHHGHSPRPTPTHTTSPTPTQTPTPSPSPTHASANCVTSKAMGHCQYGKFSEITGADTNPYVDQNVWSPIPGWQQTLYATDPSQWFVTANMPAGNTAVVSYPNTGFFYYKALSKFNSIISSSADTIPRRSGTNAEATYDIWLGTGRSNDWVHEVMIQNDYSPGRAPTCGSWTAKNVMFGGSDGVPRHPWDLCVSGSTDYWETANGNMPSCTVNGLAMLNWLVSHGQLPQGLQLGAYSYGFEISSTGGVNEHFKVRSFTAAATS
jgi:hypothetical protein